MLVDLMSRYDPIFEPVVLGHCVSQSVGFLQGDVGWLMSRRAAGDFLRIAQKWLLEHYQTADIHWTAAMQRMRLSVRDSTTPYVLGRFPAGLNVDDLTRCPRVGQVLCRRCKSMVAPLRNVVFLHAAGGAQVTLDGYPASVHWFTCGDAPQFCQMG
jgi:hypothetical protein